MTTEFRPSELLPVIRGHVPFCDTLDKCECEITAALIVLACVDADDEWVPVSFPMLQEAMKRRLFPNGEEAVPPEASKDWAFVEFAVLHSRMVDPHGLIAREYAEWDPDAAERSISLTPKAFAALSPWVERARRMTAPTPAGA